VLLVLAPVAGALGAFPERTQTTWGGPAEIAYETGFAHDLRKHADGGVCLFDMDLIENDAPGSGRYETGAWEDVVWSDHRARKILQLDDPRARRAFLVLFTHSEKPPHPLTFDVNGHNGQIVKYNRETYRWSEFPADKLKPGKNVIELACPEATKAEDGWSLYIARADAFVRGGGDPAHVGETSFGSTDGGKTWKESPFGSDGKTRAEYTVRLSLDRYRPRGTLETPVIDLWRGGDSSFFVPLRKILKVKVMAEGETPDGTTIEYYVRRGTSPSPSDEAWGPYESIGRGPDLDTELETITNRRDRFIFNRRYVQVKAELSTKNPLVTPVVRSLRVAADTVDTVRPLTNVFVVQCDNPLIRYPSVNWEWESWDRPEFAELRKRENLDEVIAGARTQFEAQVRLLDHSTKRFLDGDPIPEYPGWDALSILDRIDNTGAGGMCIQSNNVLGGLCMAYGWQARHVNIIAHEVCEVWNDEFGKWIYLDAHRVNHYAYDNKTGEPMSILDLHRRYLEKYYPEGTINWMQDKTGGRNVDDEFTIGRGTPQADKVGHNGLTLAAFARMVPRNNWYAKPFPRPLTHGCTWWPWDGYVNWYDEKTPPKRQYSRHTDRPQDMWPELNRVHVHASSGVGNDRLFLRFETYTPNFSHFEVDVDESGWKQVGERWVWLLQSGRNTLRVRAVNKLESAGKPTVIALNRTDVP